MTLYLRIVLAFALILQPLSASLASHPCNACATYAPEIFRLKIVNDSDGDIAVSTDCGATWESIGRVLRYTNRVNTRAYTASKWVMPGRVAASAVNAIHVTTGIDHRTDHGAVFSILPKEFLAIESQYRSFLSQNSSIYTNIPAGHALFGGGVAPFVGNPVFIESEWEDIISLPSGYVPCRGDHLIIVVQRPESCPVSIEFQNHPGGRVTLRQSNGSTRLLGYVIRPVAGIGRFAGSVYADVGRVRANHAGVIDISTSPLGSLGAFQIIPFGHALSPEMGLAWERTQWMIVGPLPEESALWESLMPLFCGYIRPDYGADDLYRLDWRNRLLARFLIDIDCGHGWEPMPYARLDPDPSMPLPAWADSALAMAKRVRILFPLAEDSRGRLDAK